MKIELMAGQYLDIYAGSKNEVKVDEALLIATYKSGKYTIERPLHFGAALAQPSTSKASEIMEIYTAFGIPLGVAFQLRDDLLGVFGDSSLTGKPAGDDLIAGKRTALIAYALESFNDSKTKEFNAYFGRGNLSPDELEQLRVMIIESKAPEFIEQIISEKSFSALSALNNSAITDEARELLEELAITAIERSA